MVIGIFADSDFNFDKQNFITIQVEENIDVEEANIFYQVNFFEAFEFWKEGEQGCCICMYLIYADEEDDIAPVIIEHDRPKDTPHSTQTADNTIREYLIRQQEMNKNG